MHTTDIEIGRSIDDLSGPGLEMYVVHCYYCAKGKEWDQYIYTPSVPKQRMFSFFEKLFFNFD